jgi:hypothetical protein
MKHIKLFASCLLIVAAVLAAEECTPIKMEVTEETQEISTEVPKYLKGAEIVVKQTDGTTRTFSAEEFKVVPRKRQQIVSKVDRTLRCTLPEKKNRFAVVAGSGAQGGLNRKNEPGKVTVESRVGEVMGLQYQRRVGSKATIGAQITSNDTILGIIGVEF